MPPHSFLAPPSHPPPSAPKCALAGHHCRHLSGQRPHHHCSETGAGQHLYRLPLPCGFRWQLRHPHTGHGPFPGSRKRGTGLLFASSLTLPISEPLTGWRWWLQAGPSPHGLTTRAAWCGQVLLIEGHRGPPTSSHPRFSGLSFWSYLWSSQPPGTHETRRRQG